MPVGLRCCRGDCCSAAMETRTCTTHEEENSLSYEYRVTVEMCMCVCMCVERLPHSFIVWSLQGSCPHLLSPHSVLPGLLYWNTQLHRYSVIKHTRELQASSRFRKMISKATRRWWCESFPVVIVSIHNIFYYLSSLWVSVTYVLEINNEYQQWIKGCSGHAFTARGSQLGQEEVNTRWSCQPQAVQHTPALHRATLQGNTQGQLLSNTVLSNLWVRAEKTGQDSKEGKVLLQGACLASTARRTTAWSWQCTKLEESAAVRIYCLSLYFVCYQ